MTSDLLLWPQAGVLQRLVEALQTARCDFTVLNQSIRIATSQPDVLVGLLLSTLSTEERQTTRALLKADDSLPGLEDFARVVSLDAAVGVLQRGWLLRIIEEGRLESWLQPIVSAADPWTIIAHEALLRARRPDGGLIFPDQLFSAARRAGLLDVLDHAAQLAAIRAAGQHRLPGELFINFSPVFVHRPQAFISRILTAVTEAGLSTDQIVFEVVESEKITDIDRAREILTACRQAGFRIALDDVGAGYSSLHMIDVLKPDIVKLDMALIRGAEQSAFKARIIAGLVEITRELGITTIAEGVETVALYRWLREHPIDRLQGYLFARPAPMPCTEIASEALGDLCAPGSDDELIQLVYTSSAAGMDSGDIEQILRASRRNNTTASVTGVLLFVEGSILQVLEGPRKTVRGTFERIRTDPRHDHLCVLVEQRISAREFARWSMGLATLSSQEIQELPGMNSFLQGGEGLVTLDSSRVGKLLDAFRVGRYRRHITGHPRRNSA